MPDLAELIVAAFAVAKESSIEAVDMDPLSWSSADSWRRYMALLRSASCWRVSARSVAASVAGSDVRVWGHAASELLDRAADLADSAGITFGTGEITESGPGHYLLTWEG